MKGSRYGETGKETNVNNFLVKNPRDGEFIDRRGHRGSRTSSWRQALRFCRMQSRLE